MPEPAFTLTGTAREDHLSDFAEAVRAGLSGSPRSLPCRFLYDEEGSRLFEEICRLPEYYPTRAEDEILRDHAGEIAALFPAATTLVELGSGSAEKTCRLIEAFLKKGRGLRFLPIDISRSALEQSARALVARYPDLEVAGVAAEYEVGLHQVAREDGPSKLILWLGSNVGNLDHAEAVGFLARVRKTMAPGDGLLIGIDLLKDQGILERAYDDPGGVTSRFNLNLLARINRELGGDFDLRGFRHRAVFHPDPGRMEMALVSLRPQKVSIPALGLDLAFGAGEAIHTESSYKYSPAEIRALAAGSGFTVEHQWHDRQNRFCESLFRPEA